MTDRGIIFYNYGTGSAARLAVALHTLRRSYGGEVTVLSDGEVSDELCKKFSADSRLDVRVLNSVFNVKIDKNHHYLSKCRLHELTPYEVTLFIDADTITVGDLTPLIPLAERHEFVVPQFSNWQTTGRVISGRIMGWAKIRPQDMEPALAFGPAINTGVMAFTRSSEFMHSWFRVARRGRNMFIPDETSCQVILHRYPHLIVDWRYNASCRYDDCDDPGVRLIHYHGRKHCRAGLPNHGRLWAETFEHVYEQNIADIQSWAPGEDRRLRHYMKFYRLALNSKPG